MKLAPDALIAIIEILRKSLVEAKDISELLRDLDLEQKPDGKLGLSLDNPGWLRPSIDG